MVRFKTNWKYMLERAEFYNFLTPPKKKFVSEFSPCTSPDPSFCNQDEPCYSSSDHLFCVNENRVAVAPGYAWDGPSGPTVDTRNSMRASLVHDVLYQAMREGGLPQEARAWADREFRRMLKAEGMWWPRRWVWWAAVRMLGGGNARPRDM